VARAALPSRLPDFAVLSATGIRPKRCSSGSSTNAGTTARTFEPGIPSSSGAPAGANPIAIGSQLLDLFGELQRHSPVVLIVDTSVEEISFSIVRSRSGWPPV